MKQHIKGLSVANAYQHAACRWQAFTFCRHINYPLNAPLGQILA
jgi:hypothetical protein